MKRALIIIDIQNHFCPTYGPMAVREGNQTVAVANRYAREFRDCGECVVALQDWHPANHGSFASVSGEPVYTLGELNGLAQIWWPDHEVENSPGADFHPDLDHSLIDSVFHIKAAMWMWTVTAHSSTATAAKPSSIAGCAGAGLQRGSGQKGLPRSKP